MITHRKFSGAEGFAEELAVLGAEAVPTSRSRPMHGNTPFREWSSTTAALPSGMLFHCTSAGPMIGYGGTSGEHFGLVMPWVISQPAVHQGVEMTRTGLSLYGPDTQHVAKYRAESAFTVCAFDNRKACEHIVRLLGRDDAVLAEHTYSILNLPPDARHCFEGTVRDVLGLRHGTVEAFPCPQVMASIENRIFNLIAEGIGNTMTAGIPVMPRHAARLRMVSTCWELSRQQPDVNLRLIDLCTAVQASARVLQYAFLEFSGISPNIFLRNHRLTRARRMLFSGEAESVKEVAYTCGFTELGRFSSYYRELFGEYPRDTLFVSKGIWAKN